MFIDFPEKCCTQKQLARWTMSPAQDTNKYVSGDLLYIPEGVL